jgi:hypothetical protein
MVWSGLGVNYKAAQANWDADIAYFNSIGLKNIRPHLPGIARPYNSATNATWRNCAKYFIDRGFWVTYGEVSGLSAGQLTSTVWTQYHDAKVAEATYMQANGIFPASFELGNEEELKIDGSTVTQDILITNLKQLATDVKAVYSGLVGYSISYNVSGTYFPKWIAAGRGNIDHLNVHPYGNVGNNYKNLTNGGYADMGTMLAAFGADHCYITEFNLDAGTGNIALMPDETQVTRMREKYVLIKSAGFSKALVYSWVGFNNTNNDFAMKNTDGSFNSYWDVLLTDNHRQMFVN